jgi:hypothetical protein
VKYKLGVTSKIPKNTKNCSDAYWNEVMSIVARTYKKKYKALLK